MERPVLKASSHKTAQISAEQYMSSVDASSIMAAGTVYTYDE